MRCAALAWMCPCLDVADSVAPQVLEPLVNARSAASRSTISSDIPSVNSVEQNVYCMRHGHRQDEEDEVWHLTAARPWDPPLSAKGRQQAREAAAQFKSKNIDYVLTSPFVRCLQTSAEIVDELGLEQGRWLVLWPMAELCDPRLLLAGRDDLRSALGKRSIREWMWNGMTFDQALSELLAPELAHSGVRIRPEMWNEVAPLYPEKIEQALRRYERQIRSVCKDFAGRNVIVVTHGEALRAAVNMYDSRAAVYEVKHTGHVPMHRERGTNGAWEPWSLCCTSGQTGVYWSYAT
ncbi:hypothetical protein PLESTB_000491600 [Pleodorina starrii]|uniref:Uncharacterized protein n=1 Tax=Pleodorina starrii TaxID=330485 RepID=A0A9W6BGR6_9CHLO|nr:hypothetical protein PLESTM_000363100 [Pleodorina starrii]GLC51337.1 hypothetical protein PLESTB_000491600 [Pleodorina starrii]GLC63702.1 hypothetical protein PLESTF_000065100 [Pleodorina starrii]